MRALPFVIGLVALLACKPPETPEERCAPQPLGAVGCRSGDVVHPIGCGYAERGCWCQCTRAKDGVHKYNVDCAC